METHFLLRLVLGSLGLLSGIVASLTLMAVWGGNEKAMVSFQLKPEKAKNDFRILLVGNILMAGGFTAYAAGGYTGNENLLTMGRLTAAVYALFPMTVFARWWRRFR
ncbi:MAG: hypothetical protein ABEJ75_01660 [Candidatus Nanohaloarchaea archaeon]